MPTVAEQLTQLVSDRDDLVDNLTTMGISGLTGDETFTELVPEVLNIPSGGGADLSEYFASNVSSGTSTRDYYNPMVYKLIKKIPSDTTITIEDAKYLFKNCINLTEIPQINISNCDDTRYMFYGCKYITTIPQLDFSNSTNLMYAFNECNSLVSIPQLNTGKVNSFNYAFRNCYALTTIPYLDTTSVTSTTGFSNVFQHCNSLTNDSLNNVLLMCANATGYTGQKTLYRVFAGFDMSSYYPASTIQGMSNYQAFIDAGWTIGW